MKIEYVLEQHTQIVHIYDVEPVPLHMATMFVQDPLTHGRYCNRRWYTTPSKARIRSFPTCFRCLERAGDV